MRIQARDRNHLHAGNEDIQDIPDNFTYLGSIVSVKGGTEEDVTARIRKAQQAFICLRAVLWKAWALSLKTRLVTFNSNVKLVLLYGSETWRLTKALLSKVQTFVKKIFHQILGIFWPDVIKNEELWAKTGQEEVEITIIRRKWKWSALPWGRRERERPPLEWTWWESLTQKETGRTSGRHRVGPKRLRRTGPGGEIWWKPYASQEAKRIKSIKASYQ